MIAIKSFINICLLIALPSLVVAQVPNYNKAKLKRIAAAAERLNDPYTAIEYYEAYLEKVPNNTKVRYRLAEMYRRSRDYEAALAAYQSVDEQASDQFPLALFYQAEMERSLGKKKKAREHYAAFRKGYTKGKDKTKYRRLAKNAINGLQNESIADSNQAVLKHLNGDINKVHIEFAPMLLDSNHLVYASLQADEVPYFKVEEMENQPKRQFYHARRNGEEWSYQGKWEEIVGDSTMDIGNGVLSPDGNHFYFTKCKPSATGEIICSIWRSQKKER